MRGGVKKEGGGNSKWTKTVDVRQLGNLPNSPALQTKMAELTQQFPTPRVQTDDGNQDVADVQAREDLLLDYYMRVDGQPGKVRIPIGRAIHLISQRGLPMATAVQAAPLLAGDRKPTVKIPLTSGFARTAFEQELERNNSARAEKPAPK